ncbi:uncharacterized protein SOCE26_029740 [Sorangium cellulosum]|uniref:Secreted protein n=1 Tax=Sorangium cellulosum TaxID=56 RepID=A0A2L0EQI8_SORCE|nr:hypothetical protein [Sorangium cellulosum]AUX41554.1 uncharacterized protein SOCE26_029740 [Sorangium cellulosum]
MSTLRKIQATLGLAFASALALATAAASAEDAAQPDDTSLEQTTDDEARQAGLQCTMSSGYSPTGREWGQVYLTRTPGICRRVRVGGTAPPDFPSCHQRGRGELGCYQLID